MFEIIDINDRIRELILEKGLGVTVAYSCPAIGMVSLREAGINKIFQGVTTIEEVVRETLAAED